jgi:hypothetical protein
MREHAVVIRVGLVEYSPQESKGIEMFKKPRVWECPFCDTTNPNEVRVCRSCRRERDDEIAALLKGPLLARPGFRRAVWKGTGISLLALGLFVIFSGASFPSQEALWNPESLTDYLYGLLGSIFATFTLTGILAEFSRLSEPIGPGPTGVNPPDAFPGIALALAVLFGMIITLRYLYIGASWVFVALFVESRLL